MQPHPEAPQNIILSFQLGEDSEQVMTKDPSRTEKKNPKVEHHFITPMYKNAEQK